MRDPFALPKAHLHVHLEGSIRWSTLAALAAANNRPEPSVRPPFPNPQDFFAGTAMVRDCLRTPDDFHRMALEFCADEAAEGTRWAEVSFTAAAHGFRLGDQDGPLRAVLDGFAEGRSRYGVACRLILDHSRRRPVEWAEATVELATRYGGEGVIGVGLAGDESYPAEPFAGVFAEAHRRGLHVVHHAGEAAGPDSIRAALAQGSERLGHGIRCLDDPELVAELRDRAIPLEVCPTSNVALGLVPSPSAHPLPDLIAAGLTVTLNADTPPMVGTTLTAEYVAFGFPDRELARLSHAGVDASFAPAPVKADLHRAIDTWWESPAGDG